MTSFPGNISPEDADHIRSLLDTKPFEELNDTQYSFLEDGGVERENTLLVAETGNGKTLCAEMRMKKALENNETIAYLVPSKQLTNGKFQTITDWADTDQYLVQNATWGDKSGYTTADIIVATFESYFEAVVRGVDDRLDLLVFDDFHELYSDFRGPTIEKGISAALDRGAEVFAMSATIGNPAEIAQWMNASLIMSPEDRGVPIKEAPVPLDEDDDTDYGELVSGIIRDNKERGPFILFNYQKGHTESRAEAIAEETSFEEPEADYKAQLQENLDTALTSRHRRLLRLMEEGVAFHHADLDRASKLLVEEAVKAGDIKCVSATTTIAYGFDAPIQSVIVADLQRGWGFNRSFIGKWEYIQWIGRAGRDEDLYDEAFAFPLYADDEAPEQFEFNTPVEDKSIEAIASHLGVPFSERANEDLELSNPAAAKENFRWLLLELIAGGWTQKTDISEFVKNTLYWEQLTNNDALAFKGTRADSPEEQLQLEIKETVDWLRTNGFIDVHKGTSYSTTAAGEAAFEFKHRTWVQSSLNSLKVLIDWLDKKDGVTPEELVAKLAETYNECNLNENSSTEDFQQLVDQELQEFSDGEARHTAGIIGWYWAQGIPLDTMEDALDLDLSQVPTTASRQISPTIRAVQHLFKANGETAPDWLETFADQINEGVTARDLYLTNIQGIARGRITSLDITMNRGMSGLDTDLSTAAPLVDKLVLRWSNHDERSGFRTTLLPADHIGPENADKIIDAVESWVENEAEDTKTVEEEPPIQFSARELLNSWSDGKKQKNVERSRLSTESLTESNPAEKNKQLDDFV